MIQKQINVSDKRKRDFTYRGVSFNSRTGKYHAQYITRLPNRDFKHTYIGVYSTRRLAAEAYNDYIIKNKVDKPLNKFD